MLHEFLGQGLTENRPPKIMFDGENEETKKEIEKLCKAFDDRELTRMAEMRKRLAAGMPLPKKERRN